MLEFLKHNYDCTEECLLFQNYQKLFNQVVKDIYFLADNFYSLSKFAKAIQNCEKVSFNTTMMFSPLTVCEGVSRLFDDNHYITFGELVDKFCRVVAWFKDKGVNKEMYEIAHQNCCCLVHQRDLGYMDEEPLNPFEKFDDELISVGR